MKTGADLDGVIAWNPEDVANYRPFWKYEWYRKCKPTKYANKSVDFIITGRKEHFRKITENWLKEYDVQYQKLIMFPNKVRRNLQSLSIYKAQKINEASLTHYLEDDERIVDYLKDNCSNTTIKLVKLEVDELE